MITPLVSSNSSYYKKKKTQSFYVCVAHLSFCFEKTLYRTFHWYFLPNFSSLNFIWLLGFKEDFLEITRKKNCLWWPCLLTDRDKMSNLYRGPSINASYHVSYHLAKQLQIRRFLEIDQSETRIACGGHVC
jgi:hypothetical protein